MLEHSIVQRRCYHCYHIWPLKPRNSYGKTNRILLERASVGILWRVWAYACVHVYLTCVPVCTWVKANNITGVLLTHVTLTYNLHCILLSLVTPGVPVFHMPPTPLVQSLKLGQRWRFPNTPHICTLTYKWTTNEISVHYRRNMPMYFERLSWHHARYGHHANICCGTPKPKCWVSYIFDSFWTSIAKESCYRSLVHTLSVIQHTERLPSELGWRRVSVHTPTSAVWNRTGCRKRIVW